MMTQTDAKEQILIVEDDVLIAEDINSTLQNFGYEVSGVAQTGEEAIHKAEAARPDLVLMDIMLDDDTMDGVEAASLIQNKFNIPIVYLTSHSDVKTLERVRGTKPYGYILKPYKDRELQTAIEIALRQHMLIDALKKDEQQFVTALDSIKEGVITTDRFGKVTFVNTIAEFLTDWEHHEAVGLDYKEVFKIAGQKSGEEPLRKSLEEAIVEHGRGDLEIITKTGTRKRVSYSGIPIVSVNGDLAGAILIFKEAVKNKESFSEVKPAGEKKKEVNATSILIIDEYPVLRQGVKQVINEKAYFTVCGEVEDPSQATDTIANLKPDFIISDISFKNKSGLELIKNINHYYPHIPILVLSDFDETMYAERVLRTGAKGYLMKRESVDKVISAVDKILSGEIYLSETMEKELLQKFVSGRQKDRKNLDMLSDREFEVFQLIGVGLSTNEIAQKLHLSPKTVESYRAHLKKKLNFKNAPQLLQFAIQWKLSQNLN